MRKLSAISACAVAVLCSAALASSASAENFCVGPNDMTGCPAGSTQFAASDLDDAIAATISNGAAALDSVYVYSGEYTTADGFDTSNSFIRVYGVGPTKPKLSIAGAGPHDGKTVLNNSSPTSSFQDLEIELPAADANIGISATSGGSTIRNVFITGPGSTNAVGLELGGSSPEVYDTIIDLPYGPFSSTAIEVNNSSSLIIRDTTVARATNGLKLTDSQSASIQRVNIIAARGIDLVDSPGAGISSSLIQPTVIDDLVADGFSVRSSITTGEIENAANVYNSTLVGRVGSGSNGVVADSTNAGSQSIINLDSTVIFGHDAAAETTNGGDAAVINLFYSRLQGVHVGNGAFNMLTGTSQISGDPGFANAASRDFSLAGNSSLIDAGNPAPLADSSGSDLIGNPRVVSRGAGNIRDIGAYEVQNRSPEPRITILSAVPITTSPTAFSGAASTDADGDALTYSWRFDGTAFASGVTAQRQFADPGPHSVELTVTDSTGISATTMAQFSVERGQIALQIRKQRVRMSKKGRFSILVKCPDSAVTNCTGRMIIESTKKIKRKKLRAASYVFSIEPGTTRRLTLPAYKSFKKSLKRYKKLDVAVRVLGGSTTNALVAANASTITVLTPKTRR